MIRLQRIGKKGQAHFRLVVVEHTTKPKGRYIELLGSYDPHKNNFEANGDRVKYWMSQGAQLSPIANNLLVGKKLIEGEKVQVWKAKKKEAPEVAPEPVAPKPQDTKKDEPAPVIEEETPVPTAEQEPVPVVEAEVETPTL